MKRKRTDNGGNTLQYVTIGKKTDVSNSNNEKYSTPFYRSKISLIRSYKEKKVSTRCVTTLERSHDASALEQFTSNKPQGNHVDVHSLRPESPRPMTSKMPKSHREENV